MKFSPRYGTWPKPKDPALNHNPSPVLIPGFFNGRALSQTPRYDQRLSRFPVDVRINCAGPWCGHPPSGDIIAFVENLPNGRYQLSIEACPNTFPAERKSVDKLRTCFDQTCPNDRDDW